MANPDTRPKTVSLLTFILLISAFLFSPLSAHSHGDGHTLIEAVTKELLKNPRDGEAYFRRGELYRRHGEWDLAAADFDRASQWLTNSVALDLAKGLTFTEAKWFNVGKQYLDRVISRDSNHVVALTARSKAWVQLGNTNAAIADLTAAVNASRPPTPELFIERARLMASMAPDQIPAALKSLDDGLAALGSVVSIQLHAIELELRAQHTNSALARLDKIIEQSPRKEPWLARKGEILLTAGRTKEAQDAFATALRAIEQLPSARRSVPAMQELEKRIRLILKQP